MVLGVLILSACGPVAGAQGFVQLPDGVRAGIAAVILWAVSWVIVQLITLIPVLKPLDAYKEPIAMLISAALISLIESAVPDAYGAVAVLVIQLILAILALFKIGSILAKRNVRGFKSRS
jgi:hypothetical protein